MFRLLLLLVALGFCSAVSATIYQAPRTFLQQNLATPLPKAKVLWISGAIRNTTAEILQHPPTSLRTRYWQQGTRSLWILNEIGKEQPITVGIIVNNHKIEKVQVLAFRESRGGEVRYPFFTNQFKQARLTSELQLDKPIDGITGATLSVRALTKLSRLALYYHQQINNQHDSP